MAQTLYYNISVPSMPPRPRSAKTAFPSSRHDHANCVAKALKTAELVCARRGAQFTGLRRQVLGIVWNSHNPVGAYEILAALTAGGRRPAPPTVYRALEFLQAHGLVHRIESRNAYIGCPHPEAAHHNGQFLICKDCGRIAEISDRGLSNAISRLAKNSGFVLEEPMVELAGLCPACKGKDAHAT